MTQLPLDQSLKQYYQVRDDLVNALRKLADLAEQRVFTIIVDESIEHIIPGNNLTINIGGLNQESLRTIVEQNIRAVYKSFRIAVVGEFTRGKTTLLNALLEREVLTSDRRPNTAACTTLKYGEIDRIRVTYFDSNELEPIDIKTHNLPADLARYTSDASMDPEKYEALLRRDAQSLAEQIEEVTVWLSSEFLGQRGYEVVDTPGLDSVFENHQISTYNVIPHMDAVLFLTQFNALIGEGEMIFLSSLKEYIHRFLFVMTKVDLAKTEQNPQSAIEKAISFTRSVLTNKVQLPNTPVYPISATTAIRNGLYEESGMVQLVKALDQFIANSCGNERLFKLFQSANTYYLWIEQDIKQEFDKLNNQINQLKEAKNKLIYDLRYIELSGKELSILLQRQTEQIVQNLLEDVSQLPERLRLAIAQTLDKLSLKNPKQAPIKLRQTVQNLVQEWLKKQELAFLQSAQLLEDNTCLFLSKLLRRQVKVNRERPNSIFTINVPALPFLDTLMEELKLSIMFASVISIIGFVGELIKKRIRKRIKRELISLQAPLFKQNAYEQIIFNHANNLNIYNQIENIFSQWGKSLYRNLETTINREMTGYRQQIEEQIQLINQQKNYFQQRLAVIDQQMNQIREIKSSLNRSKSTMNINSQNIGL